MSYLEQDMGGFRFDGWQVLKRAGESYVCRRMVADKWEHQLFSRAVVLEAYARQLHAALVSTRHSLEVMQTVIDEAWEAGKVDSLKDYVTTDDDAPVYNSDEHDRDRWQIIMSARAGGAV